MEICVASYVKPLPFMILYDEEVDTMWYVIRESTCKVYVLVDCEPFPIAYIYNTIALQKKY